MLESNIDRKSPFVSKLHALLEDADIKGFSHIVCWLADGKGFKIHDEEEFCRSVMPRYFKQTKLKSFTRQLYIYGFAKVSLGPDAGAFFHSNFTKSDKMTSSAIPRRDPGEDRRRKKSREEVLRKQQSSLMERGDVPRHFRLPQSLALVDGKYDSPVRMNQAMISHSSQLLGIFDSALAVDALAKIPMNEAASQHDEFFRRRNSLRLDQESSSAHGPLPSASYGIYTQHQRPFIANASAATTSFLLPPISPGHGGGKLPPEPDSSSSDGVPLSGTGYALHHGLIRAVPLRLGGSSSKSALDVEWQSMTNSILPDDFEPRPIEQMMKYSQEEDTNNHDGQQGSTTPPSPMRIATGSGRQPYKNHQHGDPNKSLKSV